MFALILAFSCNKAKTENALNNVEIKAQNNVCENFIMPEDKKLITRITVTEHDEELKAFSSQEEIDSICNRLDNSCYEFIKFGSESVLNFYKKDSLSFFLVYGDQYFKHKGVVYRFN